MQWFLNLLTPLEAGLRFVGSFLSAWFKETLGNLQYVAVQSVKILVVVIAVLLLPIGLMTMPIDTQIQLDLKVNRLSFRVTQQPLELGRLNFHNIMLRDFQQVEFKQGNTPVSIVSQELLSSVQLETANPTTTEFGTLQPLTIEPPAKVTLAVAAFQSNYDTLTITIEEAVTPLMASVLPPSVFQLTADQCKVEGLAAADPVSVSGLSHRHPEITVTGKNKALTMILDIPTQESLTIFQKMVLSHELEFISEDLEKGQRVADTTLLAEGVLSYPEYPQIEPVTFKESNFVWLAKMDDFYIEQIVLDSENRGVKIRLIGWATEPVITYPKGFSKQRTDHRLTFAEILGQGSKFVGVLLNLLIYLIPIIIGLVAIGKVEIVPRPKQRTPEVVRLNSENRGETQE